MRNFFMDCDCPAGLSCSCNSEVEVVLKRDYEALQKEINRYKNLYGKSLRIADGQIDEIDDLKNEISHLKRSIVNNEVDSCSSCLQYAHEIESLKAELAKERSVVNFYADGDNWSDTESSGRCPSMIMGEDIDHDGIFFKGGKLARQRQRERDESE